MNTANWMRGIPGNLLISQISIPGTHDSATYTAGDHEGFAFVQTQHLSIADQLLAGCRFLDIRGRLFGNALTIHHESFYLHLNFDDVLGFCQAFLQGNPSECVLMSLKEEYERGSKLSYEQVVQTYISKNPSLWYTADRLPTLDSVRGKIVLLRRFELDPHSAPLGIPLNLVGSASGNDRFSSNPPETLHYEDLYAPNNIEQKQAAILANIGLAQANTNPGNLYLTFTSGYKSFPPITPQGMARVINPWLSGVIFLNQRNLGMLAVDFITRELCASIIDSNFRRSGYLFAISVTTIDFNNLLLCATADGQNWSHRGPIGRSSQFAPALVEFQGQLLAAFVAHDNRNPLVVCASADGLNWSDKSRVGQFSKSTPSLAVFHDRLALAFVADNSTNTLLVCSSADGASWSANTNVGHFSKSAPSLAAFNDRLYLAFVADNKTNTLLTCSSADGLSWSEDVNVGQSGKFAPALAVFNDRLYLAFVADNKSNSLLVCSSADGRNWSEHTNVGQFSKSAPALAVFDDRLYLAFVADNDTNSLLACSSADGKSWSANSNSGQLSKFAPSLAAGIRS